MNKPVILKLMKIITVIFGTLLCILIAGTQVATQNSAALNSFLKARTFEKIDNPDDTSNDIYFTADYSDATSLGAYCNEAGYDIESEGMVLLKNENNALPLGEGAAVSCFMQGALNLNYSTSGSSASNTDTYTDFKGALTGSGFAVNETLLNFYDGVYNAKNPAYGRTTDYDDNIGVRVYVQRELPWSAYSQDALDSFASYGGAAIVVLARDSGEGVDVSTAGSDGEDGSYLSITPAEEDILKQLTTLKNAKVFDKIVVLLNSAVLLELDFLYRTGIEVDACMWVGNLGKTGALAVADALAGKINPSGRLTDTHLRNNFSSPAMASWAMNKNKYFAQSYSNYSAYGLKATQQYYAVYVEGIYVGYRYYETRYEDYVLDRGSHGNYDYSADVAFPFGYGKSYTTFAYSGFTVTEKDDAYEVSLTVTNTGARAGKETVQVYLQKPYDPADKVEKAAVELAGFAKTGMIEKGGSETVTVTVGKETLRSYDAEGNKTYVLSKGKYYLAAGYDSHNALNNILAAKNANAGWMTGTGDSAFAEMIWDNPAPDAKKYAKSAETSKEIKNRLDFMDINRYENRGDNKVTYVSRSDWAGTWPASAVSLSVANSSMAYDLSSKKEIKEDGSVMPSYGVNNGLTIAMLRHTDDEKIPYDDPRWESLLDQMTFAEQSKLLTDAAYNTTVVESVGKPPTSDHDSPTSVVGSVTKSSFPSEGVWASSFNLELIGKVGDALAEDALMAGLQSLYAPGINIHRTPFGGRMHEYFSEDPFLSGMACIAEVKALQNKGVVPTLKHYAFNNEETRRNGIGIWMNEQEAREIMLLPFEYAMRPSMGNAHGVMTSFNRAGCIWTSASTELMIDITRTEWDFDGYSLTDMASANAGEYMVYSDGIFNGTDCFLGAGSTTALDSYKSSPAFAHRMREASHRILYVVANYSAAMNGMKATSRVITIMPWWQVTLISLIVVTAVITAAAAGFWIYLMIKNRRPA